MASFLRSNFVPLGARAGQRGVNRSTSLTSSSRVQCRAPINIFALLPPLKSPDFTISVKINTAAKPVSGATAVVMYADSPSYRGSMATHSISFLYPTGEVISISNVMLGVPHTTYIPNSATGVSQIIASLDGKPGHIAQTNIETERHMDFTASTVAAGTIKLSVTNTVDTMLPVAVKVLDKDSKAVLTTKIIPPTAFAGPGGPMGATKTVSISLSVPEETSGASVVISHGDYSKTAELVLPAVKKNGSISAEAKLSTIVGTASGHQSDALYADVGVRTLPNGSTDLDIMPINEASSDPITVTIIVTNSAGQRMKRNAKTASRKHLPLLNVAAGAKSVTIVLNSGKLESSNTITL